MRRYEAAVTIGAFIGGITYWCIMLGEAFATVPSRACFVASMLMGALGGASAKSIVEMERR